MKTIKKVDLNDFIGGWFIGNFEPTLLKTDLFEVSVKTHLKGEVWPKHFHKLATEYNCVVSGEVVIDGISYSEGSVFVVEPGYVVDPEFTKNCKIVCVKVPCVKDDKYIIDR